MNIYVVPMLISGILCALLSIITWLFRRRENINRIFSYFTLALAVDAFAFFAWGQFGTVEHIHTWMRIIFTAGFIVPTGLVFFFLAFTGYDKKLDSRILGVKVRHFRFSILFIIFLLTLFSQFTDLLIQIPEHPQNISDIKMGSIGMFMLPLFGGVFVYLFTMAFKSHQATENKPQKKFIYLLALGTMIWLLVGYVGALVFPIDSQIWSSISYLGTGLMAVFYFVAIINFQSDKVHELNVGLERKVANRTKQLNDKNNELKNTLDALQQMQKQIIVQEKMASLGQLVAGLTHEFNTPLGTILSMNDTKSKASIKLQNALEKVEPGTNEKAREIKRIFGIIAKADQSVQSAAERLNEIIKNLKNFARLDEAETVKADIHEGLDSVLALIEHDLLKNIEVVREYEELPQFMLQPRKLNQVFMNLIKNACQAIETDGKITITTGYEDGMANITIRDNGKGIEPAKLETIFDPSFTTKNSTVRARLGLSISYQLVREHNGNITVESEPGKGTVFTVILPINSENYV